MECRICYESVTEDNIEVLECMHSLCQSCLGNLRHRLCPFCRAPIGGSRRPSSPTPLPPGILVPRVIYINAEIRPRRRRRRRARRRAISPQPNPRAPTRLSSYELNELLGRPDVEEAEQKESHSVSDKARQCRRSARNRWRQHRYHVSARIPVR